MKKQFDSSALLAQFAAKGGVVQKIETGVRAIESDRTIYAAMREGVKAVADSVRDSAASEAAYHREHDAYTAARIDGWTSGNAADYAQAAREVL